MVKLLVYYHPDSPTAAENEAFTAQVADDCRRFDMGLMLEPLSYSLTDNKLTSDEKRQVVVETARRLTLIPGVDILKAELPQDINDPDESGLASACAEVTEASKVPWILLSAAVSFDTYLRQVTTACQVGASGVAAGRAIWQEAVNLTGQMRLDFLQTTARQRMQRLNALCVALARPFTDHYASDAPFDWYKNY